MICSFVKLAVSFAHCICGAVSGYCHAGLLMPVPYCCGRVNADKVVFCCRYVMDVYMPRDRMNRAEHRGFGFVTFETEAAILRVASYGGHMIRYVFSVWQQLHGLCTCVGPSG